MRSLEVHLVPGLTPRPTDDHLGHWHPTPGEPFLPLLRTNDCHALVVTGWNERGPDFGEGLPRARIVARPARPGRELELLCFLRRASRRLPQRGNSLSAKSPVWRAKAYAGVVRSALE
jgi:hypothetical protein